MDSPSLPPQLGIPGVSDMLGTPEEVAMLREKGLVDIAGGGFHTVVLSKCARWRYEASRARSHRMGRPWLWLLGSVH